MTHTEKHIVGKYQESTTGLQVIVLLLVQVRVTETTSLEAKHSIMDAKYQTEAGQDCYEDGISSDHHRPNILRLPTMVQKEPLYLIRQR